MQTAQAKPDLCLVAATFYPPSSATLPSGWFDDVLLKCGALMPLDPDFLGSVNEHKLRTSNWPDKADIMDLHHGVLYGFPGAGSYAESVLTYGIRLVKKARAYPDVDFEESLTEHLECVARCLALFAIYLR